jgi:hypothetical protein
MASFELLNQAGNKPFMNIVANKITCNEIIYPPQIVSNHLFQCHLGAPTATPALSTVLCDVLTVPNANFNIVTNTYTAPTAQTIFVSANFTTACGAVAIQVSPALSFTVNGVVQNSGASTSCSVRLDAFGSISNSLTNIIQLNAGDTVWLRYSNVVLPGAFNQSVSFCGMLV